ncbi:MAG: hypothetical protein ACYC6T_04025 [Thermoleophilia bacterium]
MAKKEMRRAIRQAQKTKDAGPRRPTIRRAAIQGAILSAIYLVIVQIFMKSADRPLYVDVFWTLIFWVFYSVFIYYWETFLFNRRQRKQQDGKK